MDDLKKFSLDENSLKWLALNPEFVERASEVFGPVPRCDLFLENFVKLPEELAGGGDIWLGCPGLDQMDAAVALAAKGKFKTMFLVVPELKCMPWCATLEGLDTSWCGSEPGDAKDPHIWIDEDGRNVRSPAIMWNLVKIVGDQ
jgi:hypothetical protein